MNAVRQPTYDTCLPACLATILGVEFERLPCVDHSLETRWLTAYNRELQPLGIALLYLDPLGWTWQGLWIAEVPSKLHDAPGNHVVVMRRRRLVWDPSTVDPYERVLRRHVLGMFLVVPLEPRL